MPGYNDGWRKKNHPMVKVSWDEARAYCAWAGGRLPSEAEWEYAARGGVEGVKYPWGDERSHEEANYWRSGGRDQWKYTAPVASFPSNGYGLYDMAGNVWEHVADWWVPGHPAQAQTDPAGPPKALAVNYSPPSVGPRRVVKGGSWLCAPNFCLRYRPAARQPFELGLGSNHTGFRVVKDVE
jgi:formylglycine-generating enzyme required for sulfatase activity